MLDLFDFDSIVKQIKDRQFEIAFEQGNDSLLERQKLQSILDAISDYVLNKEMF